MPAVSPGGQGGPAVTTGQWLARWLESQLDHPLNFGEVLETGRVWVNTGHSALIFLIAVYAVGVLYYIGAKALQRHRGIDLGLLQREIPPE